jgi:DNA repair exonuclease SbcCD nuclease subunit
MKTARFLVDQIRKLHACGIRVFIIRGNHDALSKITKELTFPDTVKIFGGRAEAVAIDRARGAIPVTIHGLSFAQPQAPESLLPRYRPPTEGAVNIGLMHTSLDGAPGHDPYAPCKLADLQGAGFRYWALGHIHRRAVVTGDTTVVMPGIPQGRDINEAGAKSATLVNIADDGSITVEERMTGMAQFERVSVDLTGIDDWRALVAVLDVAFERARRATRAEHLVARLQLTGATPLAWRLRRDRDLLKAEASDRAGLLGRFWVEAVDVASTGLDRTVPGEPAADPVTELRRIMLTEVRANEGYRADAAAIADELRGQLPPECRGLLGTDQAGFEAGLAEAIGEGIEDVLARLQAGGDAGSA